MYFIECNTFRNKHKYGGIYCVSSINDFLNNKDLIEIDGYNEFAWIYFQNNWIDFKRVNEETLIISDLNKTLEIDVDKSSLIASIERFNKNLTNLSRKINLSTYLSLKKESRNSIKIADFRKKHLNKFLTEDNKYIYCSELFNKGKFKTLSIFYNPKEDLCKLNYYELFGPPKPETFSFIGDELFN